MAKSLCFFALACVVVTHALPLSLTSTGKDVCGLKYNYCPRDPGCATYTMSVHDVTVTDLNATSAIKIQDVSIGSLFDVEVTGITTIKSIPESGSYRIYALTGGNIAVGVLSDVLTLGANGAFTMKIQFAVEASNFGTTKDLFEFGLDVFLKKSGSDEGTCIQVESDKFVAQAEAKEPPFEMLCSDGGDGHFELLKNPIDMPVHDVDTGAQCEAPSCSLGWYYCPRDPGCTTYTMSTTSVEFDTHDSKGYKVGDNVTLIVKGSTTIKAIPGSGSYRIYALSGGNVAAGVLDDVMTLTGSDFVLDIPFQLTTADFDAKEFEFGLDVFQKKSGSDEGMCIEIANPTYIAAEQAKQQPPFVTDCKDEGGGHFVSTLPGGTAEVIGDVLCKL
jgi:hypothetical protein